MRINRFTLKDWIANIYYRIRFNYYRKHKPYLLKNHSSKFKKNYTILFDDDFDKVSWEGDNRKWNIGEPWGAFHPDHLNKYFCPPKLGTNSCAIFYIEYDPKTFTLYNDEVKIPYKASWLNTAKTFVQQYGRFECRMTLPIEKGVWPAFWLWGPTHPPEIDVIEAYGRDTGESVVYQEINVHWRIYSGAHRHAVPWKIKIDDYNEGLRDRFHEFAMEWNKDGIYIYTDGILVYQFTNKKVLEKMYNKEYIKPFMLINHNITSHVDGSEKDKYYSEFKVDYVRAYQYYEPVI